ncbi:MAG: phosphoethanolamine transferase [Bacteroidales bacterium]|nr:phosphoethanolamine transferase [Bacteroidales bacterium]
MFPLKRKPSITGLFLLLLLAGIGFLGMIDLVAYEYHSTDRGFVYVIVVLLCFFKASLFALLFACIQRLKSSVLRGICKGAAILFVGSYILLCLSHAFCFYTYGFGISLRLMNILLQTTPSETLQYIPVIGDTLLIMLPKILLYSAGVFAIAFGVAWVLVAFLPESGWFPLRISLYAASLICLCIFMRTYKSGRNAVSVFGRSLKAFVELRHNYCKAEEMYAKTIAFPYEECVNAKNRSNNFILIIGESADRRHCSSYGYPLPTNAYTSAYRDSLLFFSDAITAYTGTDATMARLLTFMDDAPDTEADAWHEYPNLISLAKKAGYRCYWLSNQQKSGTFMDCTSVVGGLCDQQIWLQEFDNDALLAHFDIDLLAPFQQIFSDSCQTRFIVLHLMGAHPEYSRRYPKDFGKFSREDVKSLDNQAETSHQRNIIAEYDNAMLYTDSVVVEIIKTVFGQEGRNILLYLSDHGQNVFDTSKRYGHDKLHAEIPFFIYANPAWRESSPILYENLKSHTDAPVSSAHLIHTLLSLAGIDYPLRADSLDLSSSAYRLEKRFSNKQIY